ncbi:MAG: HAD family phosphatase [candidate division NC10 bacterium]|nr:HAD family phosphatase [candidate division NC10 bacterium]MBI2164121.1 HAD family phosphatase [candidate division NC10 bacterium]MBI2457772.1 HAD family phosphatase [candidate division NC10 bacterium]MBI2561453.1 HAD family phosphatase [candidate division NC10 bacterium]
MKPSMRDARYRLIVLDVDGTLVDRERRISPDTLRALEMAQASGIRVTLATGRMLASASPYARKIRADAPLILYNGARIQDPGSGAILYSAHLPRDQAIRGARLARQFGLHANLYLGEGIYIERVSEISRESARKDGVEQVAVGDLVGFLEGRQDDPVKILLIGPGERLEAFAAAYRAGTQDLPHLVRSEPTYLEILRQGVTKGAALLRLCELLGIPPSAAVAFGDNLNDLEMIQAAGLGVAMGNANADLKQAARVVAPSNDEDGVATVLRAHVLR